MVGAFHVEELDRAGQVVVTYTLDASHIESERSILHVYYCHYLSLKTRLLLKKYHRQVKAI